MSKKITNFFKVELKNSKTDETLPKLRECRVIVKDIIKEIQHQNVKNLKIIDSKSKDFKKIKIYKTKMHSAASVDNFECDFDGKIFTTRNKLHRHMYYHQLKVKCKLCQVEVLPIAIKRHMISSHQNEKKFQCKICKKYYKTKYALKIHIQNHDKKFKCQICFKLLPDPGHLNTHIKNYHENPGNFECEICSKKFNRKSHLKIHQNTHDKNCPKPYKCIRCSFSTDRKWILEKHEKMHVNLDKKIAAMKNPIKCQTCSTLCKDKCALYYHMKYVHPEHQYQCDLCGKYIKSKINLTKHIKEKNCHFKIFI